MTKPHYIYLTRSNPTINKLCYYSLRIDLDLFGRWSLIRQWGRLDANGGALKIDSFETKTEALYRLTLLIRQKLNKGYVFIL